MTVGLAACSLVMSVMMTGMPLAFALGVMNGVMMNSLKKPEYEQNNTAHSKTKQE
jgi:hypothetical protein